jgi:hypothetical protein
MVAFVLPASRDRRTVELHQECQQNTTIPSIAKLCITTSCGRGICEAD